MYPNEIQDNKDYTENKICDSKDFHSFHCSTSPKNLLPQPLVNVGSLTILNIATADIGLIHELIDIGV